MVNAAWHKRRDSLEAGAPVLLLAEMLHAMLPAW
jgi:hypothetical protein